VRIALVVSIKLGRRTVTPRASVDVRYSHLIAPFFIAPFFPPVADAENDYDTPNAVSAVNSTITVSDEGVISTTLPSYSFVVLTVTKA
jgi:hypothetical protein